mgnify:CR=1 FL=1
MTNREIVQNLNNLYAMQSREEKNGAAKLSVRVGYAVRKNIDMLNRVYRPYSLSLEAIQGKYLTDRKYDDSGQMEFREGKEKEGYEIEVKELLDVDNGDISIHKVSLADLESCSNLTMADQDALYFMVEG